MAESERPDPGCIECGRPVSPGSLRCRRHAAAYARSIQQRLLDAERRKPLVHGGKLALQSREDGETDILLFGTRLAANIGLPRNKFRATYFRIAEGYAEPVVEIDETGARIGPAFSLAEHPFMSEIVTTGRPLMGVLGSRPLGPNAVRLARAIGVVCGAGVPVMVDRRLHGIVSVAARVDDLPEEVLDRLIDVGRILEFALATNARGGGDARRSTWSRPASDHARVETPAAPAVRGW